MNQLCCCLGTKSCLTLREPLDSGPPGPSVHGILQARTLEWVAISSSRGSSQPRNRICVTYLQMDSLPPSHLGSPLKINDISIFKNRQLPTITHTRVHGTYVYTDPPVTGRELPAGLRVTTSRDVSPRPALDTHGQRDSAMVFPFAFASLPVSELC